VVIDWVNARAGAADLDTALSALILAGVLLTGPPLVGPFLDAFRAQAPGDPLRSLEEAIEFRRWQLRDGTAAELAAVDQGADLLRGPGPVAGPGPAA
jgi:hypothetical protein